MGRGKKREKGATRAVAASLGTLAGEENSFRAQKIALADLLGHGHRAPGEVIALQGGNLVLDGQTDPLLARGLTNVLAVNQRPDGLYFIRFHDGERALLDLDNMRVAFSDGTSSQDPRLFGALARAIASGSFDESDIDGLKLKALMGDYLNQPSNPAHLKNAADAAQAALEALGGELTLNSRPLQEQLGSSDRSTPPLTPPSSMPLRPPMGLEFDAREAQLAMARATSNEARPMSENEKQLKGMVFGWKHDENRPAELNELLVDMGTKASVALDEPVVDDEFIKDLYLNETLTQTLGSLFERYSSGQRTFGFMGKPGTGKDTAIRVAAALLKRPMVTFNGGKGVQLQEWIGGETLKPHTVYDKPPCGECEHCVAGDESRCSERKVIAAFNITDVQYGRLTRALQQASVVHISEIRGMEDQLYAFADLLGSGIGADATNRFFSINSAHGTETIHVHPHCLVTMSWNPEIDDWRPHPATLRRMGLFCFDPLSKEEEAERLAAMSCNILAQQPSFPEFHSFCGKCANCKKGSRVDCSGEDSERTEKPFTAKDLLPISDFYIRFLKAVEGEADEISSAPSPQLFSYFFTDVVLKAANQAASTDDASAADQAIQWSLSMLEGYLNQNLPRTERKKKLTALLGAARGPLDELVKSVRQQVTAGDVPTPAKKPKK